LLAHGRWFSPASSTTKTEVEMLGIEDLAVSKYSTKKAFDKSSSFINQFE
jgi:hypothetical protein